MEIVNIINQIIAWFRSLGVAVSSFATLASVKYNFQHSVEVILAHEDFRLLYNIMIPVGIALAVMYTSMDIIEKSTVNEISLDQIISSFLKMIVAIAIINNGIEIFQGLNAISVRFVEIIQSAVLQFSETTNVEETIIESNNNSLASGIWSIILWIINLVNPAKLISLITNILLTILMLIVIPIAAIQRAVRFGFFCLTSPVVLSDTSGQTLITSKMITYFFNLLKLALEFPVIYFSVYLLFYLQSAGGTLGGGMTGLGSDTSIIACIIVCCSLVFKGREFTKNLF